MSNSFLIILYLPAVEMTAGKIDTLPNQIDLSLRRCDDLSDDGRIR